MIKNFAAVFEISVNELLDSKIPESNEKLDMEAISQQLAIINEQYAEQNSKRRRVMRCVLYAVCFFVALGVLSVVLPRRNEIWNNFGRNLFHSMNG